MSYELRAKLLDYLIIFILLTIVAISPWFFGSLELAQKYSINIAALLALLLWLVKKSLCKEKVSYYPIYLPLFCFVFLSALSILFSIYRYASLLETLNLISYAIIFFIVTQTVNNVKRLNLFIWIIILSGLFYSAYGILQFYGFLAKDFWTEESSLSSRFVNSGSFGAFVNIIIFLSLGMAFSSKKVLAKIISFLFLAISVIGLILSKSRLSWIVFILILILFFSLSFKKLTPINRKTFIFSTIFVIIICSLIFAFKSLIWQRLQIASQTQFQSLNQRFNVWIGTVRLILARPFGAGAGAFQYIYPSFRTHSDRFLVEYAHSDFLQIASELGILGLGIFIFFLLSIFSQAFKALFRQTHQKFFIIVGLICASLSFIAQSLVDFPICIPAIAILFFITLALLIGNIFIEKPKTVALNGFANIVIILIMAISLLLFTGIYSSKKYYLLAEQDFSHMRWQEALANYNKSIKLMPMYAQNYANKASIYALKETLAFGPKKKEYFREAESNFKKAISLNPYQSNYYLNLALLYAAQGREKEAIKNFKKAIERSPTDGEYYYPYADYCLEHGLLEEALETYRKSLTLFVNDDGRFAKLYGSIQGLFEKIYKYTQDYSQLRQAVPSNKLDIRLAFTSFLEQKKMIKEALAEYEGILMKYPDNETAQKAVQRLKRE